MSENNIFHLPIYTRFHLDCNIHPLLPQILDGQSPGGISTFTNSGKGKNWWKLDAGTEIPIELELINDHGNHWLWKPRQAMPMSKYKIALQLIGESFYKVS